MYPSIIADNISRIVGLIAYFLLFALISTNFFKSKFGEKWGRIFNKVHIYGSILTFLLITLHPTIYLVSTYLAGGKLDPYVAFINLCLICKTSTDYFLTIGRVSFWLLALSFLSLILKKTVSFFVKHWEKIQIINYVAFLLIGIHAILLGSYIKLLPLLILYAFCYLIVLYLFLSRELPKILVSFKSWVRS